MDPAARCTSCTGAARPDMQGRRRRRQRRRHRGGRGGGAVGRTHEEERRTPLSDWVALTCVDSRRITRMQSSRSDFLLSEWRSSATTRWDSSSSFQSKLYYASRGAAFGRRRVCTTGRGCFAVRGRGKLCGSPKPGEWGLAGVRGDRMGCRLSRAARAAITPHHANDKQHF